MRKGMLHAIEGVIAALILLSYTNPLFSLSVHEVDWETNILKQQSRDFMSSFKKTNLSDLIVEDQDDTLFDVFEHLLGKDTGFTVTTKNLIKPIIRVGILDADTTNYENNLKTTKINGRETKFKFKRVTTNKNEWYRLNVLIIPAYRDDLDEENLTEFLDENKGILYIADLDDKSEVGSVEENVFGLQWVGDIYGIMDNERETILTKPPAGKENYFVRTIFYNARIKPDTSASGTGGYDVSGISVTGSYQNGDLCVWSNSYKVLVVDPTGSGNHYNTIYIDSDGDMVFEEVAEGPLLVGSHINVPANSDTYYIIKEIDADGEFIRIVPDENQYHLDIDFHDDTDIRLYSLSNKTEYIIAEQKDVRYETTTLNEDDDSDDKRVEIKEIEIHEDPTLIPCSSALGLLPAGTYMYGKLKLDLTHEYCVVTIKPVDENEYTMLYIDKTGNGLYTDNEEGPFYDLDYVRIGSENYIILIKSYGGSVWSLKGKWRAAVAIANYGGQGGRTAWLAKLPSICADDEWHLLKSLIVFASDKEDELFTTSRSYKTTVSTSTIFSVSEDFYQPYLIELRTWYNI